MDVILTAITDECGGMARMETVPFNSKEAASRFEQLTRQHPIIVGASSALKVSWFDRRKLIRVSPSGRGDFESIDHALKAAENEGAKTVFIGGGQKVLSEAFRYAHRAVIHRVSGNFNCTSKIPDPLKNGFELYTARTGVVGGDFKATETYLPVDVWRSLVGRL